MLLVAEQFSVARLVAVGADREVPLAVGAHVVLLVCGEERGLSDCRRLIETILSNVLLQLIKEEGHCVVWKTNVDHIAE